jgi:hypothetical protein
MLYKHLERKISFKTKEKQLKLDFNGLFSWRKLDLILFVKIIE